MIMRQGDLREALRNLETKSAELRGDIEVHKTVNVTRAKHLQQQWKQVAAIILEFVAD